MVTANSSDTYVFSGYQYNWMALYEPPGNTCSNLIGASANSAFVGLVYTPGAAISFLAASVFRSPSTGGVIADTIGFSGALPSVSFDPGYAPVPFAARLTS